MDQLLKILLLAIVQGAAELLPISSSAHVAIAGRIMHYNTGDAEWALLLVLLHTGTMFAVLVYFWSRWKPLLKYLPQLLAATMFTGAIGFALKLAIEKYVLHGQKIETIFRNLPLIAAAFVIVGVVIIAAGWKERRQPGRIEGLSWLHAIGIGIVQAIVVPFRGLSRSGCTISTAMFQGIQRMRAEEYSFALAVLLTPAVIGYEVHEVWTKHAEAATAVEKGPSSTELPADQSDPATQTKPSLQEAMLPGLLGMALSFLAGLLALRLLSQLMERGRWHWFGYYCLFAAAATLAVHFGLPPA